MANETICIECNRLGIPTEGMTQVLPCTEIACLGHGELHKKHCTSPLKDKLDPQSDR